MYNNPYSRDCPSVYRGIVESNEDPENLGRCKIRVPSVHGELTYPSDILPWARPLVLSPVGNSRGIVNIPRVGDIVWVMFEGSMKDYPIYLGGTYGTGELDIDKERIDFCIEGDTMVSYNRSSKSYTVKVDSTELTVSPSGVTIKGDLTVVGALNHQEV